MYAVHLHVLLELHLPHTSLILQHVFCTDCGQLTYSCIRDNYQLVLLLALMMIERPFLEIWPIPSAGAAVI